MATGHEVDLLVRQHREDLRRVSSAATRCMVNTALAQNLWRRVLAPRPNPHARSVFDGFPVVRPLDMTSNSSNRSTDTATFPCCFRYSPNRIATPYPNRLPTHLEASKAPIPPTTAPATRPTAVPAPGMTEPIAAPAAASPR